MKNGVVRWNEGRNERRRMFIMFEPGFIERKNISWMCIKVIVKWSRFIADGMNVKMSEI
jgi:hypothetical protein